MKGRLGEIIRGGGFSKVEKVDVWSGFLGFWYKVTIGNDGKLFVDTNATVEYDYSLKV